MENNEFNDKNEEFVIRDMFSTIPCINYSQNSDYVSSFNQFGFGEQDSHGYIFFRALVLRKDFVKCMM